MEIGTRPRRIDDRLPECITPKGLELRHLHHLGGWSRKGSRTSQETYAIALVNFTIAPITSTLYPAGTDSSVIEVFSYSQSVAEVLSTSGL